MRREERVTVQGPVNKHQPDGMSHRGGSPPFQCIPGGGGGGGLAQKGGGVGVLWTAQASCHGATDGAKVDTLGMKNAAA